MGGRGASSGMSDRGNKYGSQYHTVLKSGNIKFVQPKVDNPEPLVETMTRGRVYVLLNSKNEPAHILYFDNELKHNKTIDLRHFHAKMKPHTHPGYWHYEYDGSKKATSPTTEEKRMVDRVMRLWYNRHSKR